MSMLSNRTPLTPEQQQAVMATDNLTRIVALVDEIIELMNEEIPLVEGRKRVEHAELLKRKQRMTLDYRASLKNLVLQPEMLKLVPEDLRQKARLSADRLAEASERNARVLRAIMAASQRLVQSIVAIVKDEVLPKTSYSKSQVGSYSPLCKPVTIYKSA